MIKFLTLLATLLLLGASGFTQLSHVIAQDGAPETPAVKRIAYNPQNPTVLALAGDVFSSGLSRVEPFVMLQDIETGITISRLVVPDSEASTFPRQLNSLDWSPDGTRLLAGIRGGQVVIWDISSTSQSQYEVIHNVVATVDQVNAKWSPDGRWIAILDDASGLQIWDGNDFRRRSTPSEATTFCCPGAGPGFQLTWSPDSSSFVIGHSVVGPIIFDVSSEGELTYRDVRIVPVIIDGVTITDRERVSATTVDWNPRTNQLAFNDFLNNRLYVYDMSTLTPVRVTDMDVAIQRLVWNSTGTHLLYYYATRSASGTVVTYTILEMTSGESTHRFSAGNSLDSSLPIWSPDGTSITFALNFALAASGAEGTADSLTPEILNTREYAGVRTMQISDIPSSILVFPNVIPASSS